MFKYTHGGVVRCSFCGLKGHNIRSCKEVSIAASDEDNVSYDAQQVQIAKQELAKRQQRNAKQTNQRGKPRCGFCRSTNHNRKNCRRMKKFKNKLYKANSNWRRHFINRVNILGVGQGALIEACGVPVNVLAKFSVSPSKGSHVGIINEYDYDNLNVFCNFSGSYDYRSSADITAKLITAGGLVDISIAKYIGDDLFREKSFFAHWCKLKVINRKETQFSKKWITEKDIPMLDWLPQTHSFEELQSLGVSTFLDYWTKNVLDNND